MKSKQINYFITEEELEQFDDYLLSIGARIIGLPIYDNNLLVNNSFKEHKLYKYKWPLFFCIVNKDMVSDIKVKFVEKQGYYLIDELRSPVLEMSKCFVDNEKKIIKRARIYFNTGYFDENNLWINKEEEFIIWANDIIKEFKKQFGKRRIDEDYISLKVIEMVDNDWKLTPR